MANEEDLSPLTVASMIVGGVMLLIGGGYAAHACSIADKATLGAVEQDVDTRNYERSEAYREGLRRDFATLLLAYQTAPLADKPAILATIRQRADGAPTDQVPANIRSLLAQ